MNEPRDDIDARLERREPLLRSLRSGDDPLEPPADLDRIVLSRARAALRAARDDERTERRFFSFGHWGVPLGLATTLVLAIAITVRLGSGANPAIGPSAPPLPESEAIETEATPAGTSRAGTASEELTSAAAPAVDMAAPGAARPAAPTTQAEAPAMAASQVQARQVLPVAAPPPPPAAIAAESRVADAAVPTAAAVAGMSNRAAAIERREARDPERWYQDIVELRGNGRTEEAEREWRALQAQFPDFRPPEPSNP